MSHKFSILLDPINATLTIGLMDLPKFTPLNLMEKMSTTVAK